MAGALGEGLDLLREPVEREASSRREIMKVSLGYRFRLRFLPGPKNLYCTACTEIVYFKAKVHTICVHGPLGFFDRA